MFNVFWKRKKKQETYPCEGIREADHLLHRQRENRSFTLLWKALIVYCIVGGGMGCLLSALDTDYYVVIVQLVILIASLFLASLFYHPIWENLGYVLLFLIMVFFAYVFRSYINSGFYGVLNDVFEAVSDYFESNAMRSYGERIGNRMLAITISMCYIGVVCCLVINISISRRMRCAFSVLAVSVCLLLPLYLELEPSLFYVVQLLTGLFLADCVHRSRHYDLHYDNAKYERRKNGYSYIYSARTVAQFGGCILAIISVVAIFLSVLMPKDTYHEVHPAGQWKKQTADTVENLSAVGIAGLFNFYENVGGLTSGRLGGVSALRLDYETDLTVTFVPAAEERFYLRQFVSQNYEPFTNQWIRLSKNQEDMNEPLSELTGETEQAMKQAYEDGVSEMGKGQAVVENVAGLSSVYLPYYSLDLDQQVVLGRRQTYTYYTNFNSGNQLQDHGLKRPDDLYNYLQVPGENLVAVEQIIQEAGLSPLLDTQENVSRLAAYYQDEIPYSYQPGVTPYGKDFVNYFLLENKRGYCAHFATAATLIFRRLGIPARYVEGYAIDPEDIAEEGTVLEESKENYYEGYSELEQTAVVSVNVVDANAHAWVEVWISGQGWQVADITPASAEEEPGQGLWGMFRRFLSNGMGGVAEQESGQTDAGNMDTVAETMENVVQTVIKILAVILLSVLLFFVIWILLRKSIRLIGNRKKDRNDLLIDYYQRYVRKIGHKIENFETLQNYEEQITVMAEQGKLILPPEDRQKLITVLEKAGFGPVEISEQEDQWVRQTLGAVRK